MSQTEHGEICLSHQDGAWDGICHDCVTQAGSLGSFEHVIQEKKKKKYIFVKISWNFSYSVDAMIKIQLLTVEFRKFLSTRLFFGVSILF